MKRAAAVFMFLLAGCAARHVVPPERPVSVQNPAAFEGVRLALTSFSVVGAGEKDQPADQTRMRERLVDFIASRGNFAEVLDPGAAYSRRGPHHSNPVSLDLEVQLEVSHTANRTWILDAAGIYPFVGFWPLTPQWGSATVKIRASMKDPRARVVWTGDAQGDTAYEMIWYSWYRTEPVELAYKDATVKAFTALADQLAAKREELFAKIADVAPSPERVATVTPVENEARTTWIVAVMEISDVNADDKKKAVDTKLIRNLSDQLRVFVAQRGVRVIDRGQQERAIRDMLQEAKAESYKSCFDASCQIPLGKALAASHVLRSQVTQFGSACVLNGELIDLKSEVTIAAGSARSDCSEEGFLIASETVTTALLSAKPGT